MNVLIVYASRHGSTRGIAEFIAEKLRRQGTQVEVRHVAAAPNPGDYDAVVIGSAAYYAHWLKEAAEFVRRHRAVLADRPVWLFSSGPLGTAATDANGRDLRVVSEPKEIAELRESIHPRDHQVFSGALEPGALGFFERMVAKMPAARSAGLFPEGDFRDWKDIAAWAESIARALAA